MIKECIEKLGIILTKEQETQFFRYYEMLIEWNKKMNLTAITEFQEVVMKHFVDSLSIVRGVDMGKIENLIDIGTGAGFPGIPLKIAFPHLKITLLDSLNKRIQFLNEVVKELDLKDVETIHGRTEDFGKNPEYREKYDLVVSRAVGSLNVLSEYAMPYVKIGGMFVSYKAGKVEEERKSGEHAIQVLGGMIQGIIEFQIGENNISRTLIKIKKINSTPDKYPRKAGVPLKKPL